MNEIFNQSQIDIPEDVIEEVTNYITSEITKVVADRADMTEKLVAYEKAYEAIPATETKTFPWKNASNVIVPVTAIHTNNMVARIINAIFGTKEIWNITAKAPAWLEVEAPLNRWLNYVGRDIMNLYNSCTSLIISAIKMGTGVIRVDWHHIVRNVKFVNNGNLISEQIDLYRAPRATHIDISNFLISPDAVATGDIQLCAWVACRTNNPSA